MTKETYNTQIKDTVVYENYGEKILPVIDFLNNRNIGISKGCENIFIIFTNRCNACTKSILNEIAKDCKRLNKPAVIVINQPNLFLEQSIKKSLLNIPSKIIIDSTNYLEKNGLSFAKNLSIKICDNKIKEWKFY